jgi:hypothetical protein
VRKIAAIASALLAIAFVAIRPAPARGPLPADPRALAARVAAHPADWVAASALTEKALDAPMRDARGLWHASGELAISLAPALPEPRASMARSAFFHWNEMSEPERRAVLEAYAPVLRDPLTFSRTMNDIYALTGDLDYLRRAAPQTIGDTRALASLAATYGRFDVYRALREEIERQPHEVRNPPPHGRDGWSGLCSDDVCFSAWREVDAGRSVTVTVTAAITDDVRPYVEIYVDGARRAEGAVNGEQTFTALIDTAGRHDIEVRLANPITRNSAQRRIHITRFEAL